MIPIAPYLRASRIVDLAASTKRDALVELCRVLASGAGFPDPAAFERAVLEREDVMSTGIGLGIAVPHAKIPSVKEFALAVGRSRRGIDFQALDGQPVRIVVLIGGPEGSQATYLRILAGVTLRLKEEPVRRALLEAKGPKEMLKILK